jgi:predicted ATPase
MITSIRIDDNKKTPFKYIQKIKAFKNGSEFIFKPGVNVIVGKNGSGKFVYGYKQIQYKRA